MSIKNHEEKSLIAAAAVIIAFLVFSLSFFLVFIDHSFYDKSFAKNGAYEKIGVEGVRSTVDYLIKYLISGPDNANTAEGLQVFSEKERSHLEDVHALFKFGKYATILSIFLIILILLRLRARDWLEKDWRKVLKYSAFTALAALAILFLLSLNFSWLFVNFHYLFFPQGNWQFPSESLLIILFPADFFREFLMRVLLHALIMGAVLYLVSKAELFEEKENKVTKQVRKRR